VGRYEVCDYRNGRTVLTVNREWKARLLTALAWHGPSFIRRLWARTGMLDYSDVETSCPVCGRPYVDGECLMCDGDGNPWADTV